MGDGCTRAIDKITITSLDSHPTELLTPRMTQKWSKIINNNKNRKNKTKTIKGQQIKNKKIGKIKKIK